MSSTRACFVALHNQQFAFDGASVKQIVEVRHVTRVPRTPAAMLGLFAIQGVIYPLFDIFYQQAPAPKALRLAVLIGNSERVIGLAVDKVLGFMNYQAEAMTAEPPAELKMLTDGLAVSAALAAPRIDAEKLIAALTRELEVAA